MRIKLPFLFLLAFLFVGCSKLDITVEIANYDTRGAQVFYWVRNNSGADISRTDFAPYNEDNLKKELLENIKLISPDVREFHIGSNTFTTA